MNDIGERAIAGAVPRCADSHHCITCSDEGVPMRVLWQDADGMLARCADDAGAETEVLTGLVEAPAVGDVLLVHAGAALRRMAV